MAEVTIRDLERMAKQITSDVQRNRTVTFASKLFNMFEDVGMASAALKSGARDREGTRGSARSDPVADRAVNVIRSTH